MRGFSKCVRERDREIEGEHTHSLSRSLTSPENMCALHAVLCVVLLGQLSHPVGAAQPPTHPVHPTHRSSPDGTAGAAQGAPRFASSYGDHMVLQQAPQRAVVWGWAGSAAGADGLPVVRLDGVAVPVVASGLK